MHKSFCNNRLCRKTDRKKCVECGVYSCGGCSVNVNGRHYCIDCGWDKSLVLYFKEMKQELAEQLIK